jgi:membrane-associated protease RseP (regulator of RpoE activity)
MKMRNLVVIFAILLLTSAASVRAQKTPTPPAPPTTPMIAGPWQEDAPAAFAFSFDGSGYLGVVPENISKENMSQYGLSAPRGVGISRVAENSPAERAGLKKGDVIVEFDNEPVASTRKLMRLVGEAGPEQTVRLTISRNGSEQHVNVTLGKSTMPRAFRSVTPPDLNGYFRMNPPNAPDAPRAWSGSPETFAFAFGNNRRVGITTSLLTKQLADYFGVSGGHGILISSVSDNSPASKAGLRAGDVITEVNGEKIDDAGDFTRALNQKEDGEVTLTIIRDKSQRTIKVTPERRATPTINMSELQPLSTVTIPMNRLRSLPNFRILRKSMPNIETFVMPRMDGLTVPRMMNIPRVELVPANPGIL